MVEVVAIFRMLPRGAVTKYLPRILDKELAPRLASTGAVVIEGPKACGKTETARQIAASEVLLDIDENARQAVAIDPKPVLDGDEVPRLIDEWQLESAICSDSYLNHW